jgi:hypothetical protein
VLAEGFSSALHDLESRLTERVAHLLLPVVGEALRTQAVADLHAALARLLSEPAKPALRVSGPADLLAALAKALGPLAEGVAFAEGDGPEVRATADDTVIETQLSAWSRRLADAVGER